MRRVALLALVWSVVCMGCAFTYTEVGVVVPDPSALEVGVSTPEDALATLGPPRIVRKQFDGQLFTYRRLERKDRSLTVLPVFVRLIHIASGEERRDDVTLLFDRKGVLRAIGKRVESDEPEEERSSSWIGSMLRSMGEFAYKLVR